MFLSRSVERSLPIFKAIKQVKNFQWSEKCQATFKDLKKYLSSPPLLTKPKPGKVLYLYLVVSLAAISFVLVHQEAKVQKPIYYIRWILHDAEMRPTKLEKVASMAW